MLRGLQYCRDWCDNAAGMVLGLHVVDPSLIPTTPYHTPISVWSDI